MKCEICSKEIMIKGIGVHLKTHQSNIEDYYEKFILKHEPLACPTCGGRPPFLSVIKGFQKFCSSKCHNSNPESKLKNRLSHIGRPRPDMVGSGNPSKRPDVRAKISAKLKGNDHGKYRNLSKAQCQLISVRMTKLWADNPRRKLTIVSDQDKNYNTGTFYSLKNDKNYHYRSSYELAGYEKLENDAHVLSFEYETLLIEYVENGKTRHYKPDLLVVWDNDIDTILEIKPEKRIVEEINQLKFSAAEKYAKDRGMQFIVWCETELFGK